MSTTSPALNALLEVAAESRGRVTVAVKDAQAALSSGLFVEVLGSLRARSGFLVTPHDVVTLEIVSKVA